jgi:hypothetical protein
MEERFGDAHPGLKEGVDQELIPAPVSPLTGGRQATDLLPAQVGDYTQGLREQCPAGDEGTPMHSKLDKSLFGPILLPAAGQSQGKAGSRVWQEG